MTKRNSRRKDGQTARGSDFAEDAVIYVKDVIHDDLVIETSNKAMLRAIHDLRTQLKQDGRDAFMHTFRSISNAIREAKTDTLYAGKRLGRKAEIKAWQNLCDDVILLAACRHVLWKKPVPIQLEVEEWMKV